MIHTRLARDTVGGLFFALIGLGFVLEASDLPIGEASRMAAGYFPRLLGFLLIFLGLLISVKGTLSPKKPHEVIYRFAFKKMAILGVSLLAFAFLLEPAGLLASLSFLVFCSCFASKRRCIKEALWVTLAVDLLVLIIFVWGIGLEVNLWPQGWGQ